MKTFCFILNDWEDFSLFEHLLGDHILAVFPPKKNVSETLFRKLSLVYQGL
jgi:hypothetical protein